MDYQTIIRTIEEYTVRRRVTSGYLFAFAYILLVRPTSLFILLVGLAIAFFGLIIRFWAAGYLKKSEELCISGPYAYVRHPLYLGSFLLGFGFCLAGSSFKFWIRSGIVWFFFLASFGTIYFFQILAEEKKLKTIFGESYLGYSRAVPFFFPGLKRFEEGKTYRFDFKLFRRNREYLALIGFLLVCAFVGVRYAYGEISSESSSVFVWRKMENESLQVGEKLLFAVKWGIVPGGLATLEIPEKIEIGQRQAFRIVSHAQTNSFFDIFYKVRDRNESWMDIESLCSLGYEKHLREGNYRKDEKVIFNQEEGFALVEGKNEKVPINPYTHDVLSGLYFVRTRDLIPGETHFFDVNNNGKNWQLEVKILNREEVSVPAGKFDCWLIEPFLKDEGIFHHKGRILIWLTTDQRRIPVLMQTKIPVGTVDVELTEIKNEKN